jgi:hypothetical protein
MEVRMNPIGFALRRPKTVVVLLLSLVLCGLSVVRPVVVDDWLRARGVELPIRRMSVDIFPALNLPVIYVCQPYGGMDPAQMEGLLTNYYEYHFLYINGIHHVESRNVQGTALMKLVFHPGTNMAQAMAETINYVNRSRAMMPPGTVPPFVMRFDTGSVHDCGDSGSGIISCAADVFCIAWCFGTATVWWVCSKCCDTCGSRATAGVWTFSG